VDSSLTARLLAECAALSSAGGPSLSGATASIREAGTYSERPLRLVLAGQPGRGKSDVAWALLRSGAEIGPFPELKSTIVGFRYAPRPGATVQFVGGSQTTLSLPELRAAVTSATGAQFVEEARRVDFGLPDDLLGPDRPVHLIDLPGFAVPRHPGDADTHYDLKIAEINEADAVLYVSSKSLDERSDSSLVDALISVMPSPLATLKAVRVLSQCDVYWSPEGPATRSRPSAEGDLDPIRAGGALLEEYLRRPDKHRLFFAGVPVSGLVGRGARTLTDDGFGLLAELAAADPATLAGNLEDPAWFATQPSLAGISLPAPRRAELIRLLGAWGVQQACRHIRDGLDTDGVRSALLADSGMDRLRDVIEKGLRNRAALIKLDRELSAISTEIAKCQSAALRRKSDPPPQLIQVAELAGKIRRRQHGLAELALLADHYASRLSLGPGEAAELRRLTGEDGTTPGARLGQGDNAPPGDLAAAAAALAGHWADRGAGAPDRRSGRVAYVMQRSYRQLARSVQEAGAAASGPTANAPGPS
jgi:hypothetical protein